MLSYILSAFAQGRIFPETSQMSMWIIRLRENLCKIAIIYRAKQVPLLHFFIIGRILAGGIRRITGGCQPGDPSCCDPLKDRRCISWLLSVIFWPLWNIFFRVIFVCLIKILITETFCWVELFTLEMINTEIFKYSSLNKKFN